jgi:type I restriction enzyme S subunit
MDKESLQILIEEINSLKSDRLLKQRNKIKQQEWFFNFKGKLPSNWLEVNFMDVTWLITCGVAKKPDYVEEGIPFLSAQNTRPFKTNLDKIKYISQEAFEKLTVGGKPEKNDVLYTRVGNCGEAASIPYEFDFGVYVSLTLIKPMHELINHKFLVAFLNSNYGKIQANVGAIGIGLKNLNVENVRKYRIPLPPLPEQRAIVAKIEELFSDLDKGIADLKKAQDQLKVYRQAVLKKAFEGEYPQKKIIEIADVNTGATPKRGNSEFWENGTIPWVTSTVVNNDFVNEPSELITENAIKQTNCKLIPKGSLLVAMYGEGKTRGKCSELNIDTATNQALAGITLFKEYKESKQFVKWFFVKNYEEIRLLSSGGVQPNLNLTIIKNTIIPFPEHKQQIQIIQEIESRLSVCDKVEQSITESLEKARALRQSILKKAFEGNLLSEAEIITCNGEKDYEPASVLLKKIKAEKKKP